MVLWLLKGLTLIGDAYNGADWVIRGITDTVMKAIGG